MRHNVDVSSTVVFFCFECRPVLTTFSACVSYVFLIIRLQFVKRIT